MDRTRRESKVIEPVSLLIRNARVITDGVDLDGWVGVRGELISSIGRTGEEPQASHVIDARGNLLMPGRIEPHCHLRAAELANDLEVMSREAVAGGVTTLMPYMRTLEPYLDVMPRWIDAVSVKSECDVAFHLQIQSRKHLDEIGRLYDEYGLQSFKLHIDYRRPVGHLDIAPVDDGELYITMRQVREFDGIVAVHCENTEITRLLFEEEKASGDHSLQTWQRAIPPIAEASDVNNVVYIASQLGCRVLVVHVSAAESLEAGRQHGFSGATFETLAHLLCTDDDDAERRLGLRAKTTPPIRTAANREELWRSVEAGHIKFVGTDHSAFARTTQDPPPALPDDLWRARAVAAGIGPALPVFLTEGLRRNVQLSRLVGMMTWEVADTFGMSPRKGRISPGADADLTLVDLDEWTEIHPHTELSQQVSLVNGLRVRGIPRLTIVRGRVRSERGVLANDPGFEAVTISRT